MKLFFGLVGVLVAIVALTAGACFAIENRDSKTVNDQGVFIGGYTQGVPLEGDEDKLLLRNAGGVNRTSEAPGRTGLGTVPSQAEPFSKFLQSKDTGVDQAQPKKPPRLLLKTEPGDGLATLSWKVAGLQPVRAERGPAIEPELADAL